MIKRTAILLLTLLTAATCLAAQPPAEQIRIGLIECDTLPLGEPFMKKINRNIRDHYRTSITFKRLDYDHAATLDAIGRLWERHAMAIMEESRTDYLIYLRKRRSDDLSFVIWKKNGEREFIPVPMGTTLKQELMETAVGSFLSILFNMEGSLQAGRLY